MLIYDESFAAVLAATTEEATALGARVYGSEHLLLGLLSVDDRLARRLGQELPGLTASGMRAAVDGAADDAPHLARLGLDAHVPPATGPAGRATGGARPRTKHTPELQSALDEATAKWAHLRRTSAVPKERKVGSEVLWLAVLEPSSRSARLLDATGIRPDDVRTTLLSALVPDGAPVPAWPAEAPVGPVARLLRWVFGRTNVPR